MAKSSEVLKRMKYCLGFLPDKTYLQLYYFAKNKRFINFKNPTTFNEKIQWLKIYDRNPLYTTLVDKVEVKKYVSEKIGNEYIIPTLGVWDNPYDIDFDKLPNQFVLKCNHDSGEVFICKDKACFDKKYALKKLSQLLKDDFYLIGREWPYKNVKRKIIAEEYISNSVIEEDDDLIDYKFMCFNGKVKCIFTCSERNSDQGLKVTFFDLDWKVLPFERSFPKSKIKIEKPKNFKLMVNLAEKLAENIPFVRIDFYEHNGKAFFGEYTFYPGCGFEKFSPEEWDKTLGDWLIINNNQSSS